MSIKTKWLFLVFMVILLSACEPKTLKVAPETKKATEIVDSAAVRAAWEVQWKKTLEEAKKERSVVIYAIVSVAPAIREKEVINLFKERYGIEVAPLIRLKSEIDFNHNKSVRPIEKVKSFLEEILS